MREFGQCNNCNNTTSGDYIYVCDSCGQAYCDACRPSPKCTRCDNSFTGWSPGYNNAGRIR